MADPFSMLESDHRQVEQLLHDLDESEEGPERARLVDRLTAALAVHMEFEEAHIYPLTRQILDDETVEEANTEHELAREGLGHLSQLMSEPGFGAAVAMVEGGIKHHVEEEEDEVFPAMRRDLDAGAAGGTGAADSSRASATPVCWRTRSSTPPRTTSWTSPRNSASTRSRR